jgi:hypothetical protein
MGYYNSGKGQYQVDRAQEKVVGEYLDQYFYNIGLFSSSQRIEDESFQKTGTDIIITAPSLSLVDSRIDEKSALSYINCDIPTFAFELSSKKMGKDNKPVEPFCRKEGWLLNRSLKTDCYLLTWLLAQPISKSEHFDRLEESDIIASMFVLISKQSIIEMLGRKGFSIPKLREIDDAIRQASLFDSLESCLKVADRYSDPRNKIKFSFTTTRAEEPINVLLYRSEMIAESIAFGTISKGMTTILIREENKFSCYNYDHKLSI